MLFSPHGAARRNPPRIIAPRCGDAASNRRVRRRADRLASEEEARRAAAARRARAASLSGSSDAGSCRRDRSSLLAPSSFIATVSSASMSSSIRPHAAATARRDRERLQAAEADEVRAHRERLEHIGAAEEAAVDDDGRLAAHGRNYLGQDVHRAAAVIELATAVIRHVDRRRRRARARASRPRRSRCPSRSAAPCRVCCLSFANWPVEPHRVLLAGAQAGERAPRQAESGACRLRSRRP